jgi:hypothetical protein
MNVLLTGNKKVIDKRIKNTFHLFNFFIKLYLYPFILAPNYYYISYYMVFYSSVCYFIRI